MKSIWVVTGRTESGDEVSVVFSKKPTRNQVDGYFYQLGWDEEYKYVGFINWEMHEDSVEDPSKVTKESIKAMKKAVKECD